MSECQDKYSVRVQIERLPEGVWLATSEDLPGLVVEAPTRGEVLEAAQEVAQKLVESYCEHGDPLPRELLSRSVNILSELQKTYLQDIPEEQERTAEPSGDLSRLSEVEIAVAL